MKKFKYQITFILFFLSSNLISQISYTLQIGNDKSIIISSKEKDNSEYARIKLTDFVESDIVGTPNLPVKYVNLIIPAQKDVEKINVTFTVKTY